MSVARAKAEISSAEFSDWLAWGQIRFGPPSPEAAPAARTDDDLMAQAIAWRDRMNARAN